eukprot:3219828-Pyramimonas_sp.AAC.1
MSSPQGPWGPADGNEISDEEFEEWDLVGGSRPPDAEASRSSGQPSQPAAAAAAVDMDLETFFEDL